MQVISHYYFSFSKVIFRLIEKFYFHFFSFVFKNKKSFLIVSFSVFVLILQVIFSIFLTILMLNIGENNAKTSLLSVFLFIIIIKGFLWSITINFNFTQTILSGIFSTYYLAEDINSVSKSDVNQNLNLIIRYKLFW